MNVLKKLKKLEAQAKEVRKFEKRGIEVYDTFLGTLAAVCAEAQRVAAKYPMDSPLANVWASLADDADLTPREFGESVDAPLLSTLAQLTAKAFATELSRETKVHEEWVAANKAAVALRKQAAKAAEAARKKTEAAPLTKEQFGKLAKATAKAPDASVVP
jgi:hypothetical protein